MGNMEKKINNLVPEMEAINIEVQNKIKNLKLKEKYKFFSKGKAFEAVCYCWICNKKIKEFINDDTDGAGEFGIDSISIEKKVNGGIRLKVLSCTYSGGFSYQKVDEIKKGLKKIFDEDDYEKLKNNKLKQKIKQIRRNKSKIQEVEIYYCINNVTKSQSSEGKKDNNECSKSKENLLLKTKKIFEAKYNKKINLDFLFFDAKAIYEKKIRNDNLLSRREDISVRYNALINKFNKSKEIETKDGKIEGCIITVDAFELKKLLTKCTDLIFHYNIRKFKGKNLVNKNIADTIKSESKNKFWFLNNGITLVCEDAIEEDNGTIKLRYPQIVNGQQTLKTIESFSTEELSGVDVLVRIYITDNEKVFSDIALATNSQTRIDFADMSSNKSEQHAIRFIFESFGYYYKNKKGIEKKMFKIGIDSKMLGRISFSTINSKPTEGRRTTRDTIIFNEDNYSKLFNVNPHWLLLSFLIYNYCKKNDPGIKNMKRITVERNIKHFGYFHLSALIWSYLKDENILLDENKMINLIESNNFDKFYKKAFSKIKRVIVKEKKKDKNMILKEYFNNDKLDDLIFIK